MIFNVNFKTFVDFIKERICWCVNFIDIKIQGTKDKKNHYRYIYHHHHHHHVLEELGVLACSLILQMKLVPPSLPRSSYVSSSVCFVF